MKQITAVIAVGLLLGAPLAAQSPAGGGGFGIRGGLSYGNVSNNGVLPGDARQRTGFALGAGFLTAEPLGIGIEALYVQRGVTSSTVGDSRTLDYIDVPAYLRLGIPTSALTPYAFAGPQASFELKCGANGTNCPSGRPKTTYAGVIGAGLRFGGPGGISVEGRYIYCLTDLKLSTVTTSSSYKTRSFMLLMGLGF